MAGVQNTRNQIAYQIGTKKDQCSVTEFLSHVHRGDIVLVRHAFMLADPKSKRRRDSFWKIVDEIERRGATIWDAGLELHGNTHANREKIMRAAIEDLAVGRHKRSDSDKRGRPAVEFEPEELAKAKAIWESRKHKTWKVAVEALKKLDKRWTQTRAFRVFGKRGTDRTHAIGHDGRGRLWPQHGQAPGRVPKDAARKALEPGARSGTGTCDGRSTCHC